MLQALTLPSIMNINPRSVYNKIDEIQNFIIQEEIDCTFISESWERPSLTLDKIFTLEDYCVISNPHQQLGKGGRSALVINNKKFQVQNITQSIIQIPWGIEAVWAVLTPKNITNDSIVKKIAVCSFYSKPKLKKSLSC